MNLTGYNFARHVLTMMSGFLMIASGCSGDDGNADAGLDPLVPADYDTRFVQVRDCRQSAGHDLSYVRVFASSDAAGPYVDATPFPAGAVLVKEEHLFNDPACAGAVTQWTVMGKLAVGTGTDTLDWHWQKLDTDRQVVTENESRCYGCHVDCDGQGSWYDSTCTKP